MLLVLVLLASVVALHCSVTPPPNTVCGSPENGICFTKVCKGCIDASCRAIDNIPDKCSCTKCLNSTATSGCPEFCKPTGKEQFMMTLNALAFNEEGEDVSDLGWDCLC